MPRPQITSYEVSVKSGECFSVTDSVTSCTMPCSVTQNTQTINENAAIIEELVAVLEALHGTEPEKVQRILQLATKLKNNMFPNQPNSQQLGKQPNNQQESQQVIREPIPNQVTTWSVGNQESTWSVANQASICNQISSSPLTIKSPNRP